MGLWLAEREWCGLHRRAADADEPPHTECAGGKGTGIHTAMMASVIMSCSLLVPNTIAKSPEAGRHTW